MQTTPISHPTGTPTVTVQWHLGATNPDNSEANQPAWRHSSAKPADGNSVISRVGLDCASTNEEWKRGKFREQPCEELREVGPGKETLTVPDVVFQHLYYELFLGNRGLKQIPHRDKSLQFAIPENGKMPTTVFGHE